MKKFLLIMACALSTAAIAQQTTPQPVKLYPPGFLDSTYRPKITADSVASFKAHPIGADDVVFLGNSITARCNWAALFGDRRLRNRGISGDLTFGVLERLNEVIAGKPKKIFILIGINDISRNVPDSIIIRNHKKIISLIQSGSPKTKIYFCTLLPVNPSFGRMVNHYKEDHVLAVNSAIRQYRAKNLQVIDLYPWFLDEQQHLKVEYTGDGLHPNAAGYQVWLEIFKKGKYLDD